MSDELICPACESENIQTEKLGEEYSYAYGDNFIYQQALHICQDCGEKGSFSNQLIEENHETFSVALKEANRSSLDSILVHLSNDGNSMAYIERSLGLPQRTLSRWKAQGASSTGMALMRIIRTYPWMLKVADENFDGGVAFRELASNFAQSVNNAMRAVGFCAPNAKLLSSGNEVLFTAGWTQTGEDQFVNTTSELLEETSNLKVSGETNQPRTLA